MRRGSSVRRVARIVTPVVVVTVGAGLLTYALVRPLAGHSDDTGAGGLAPPHDPNELLATQTTLPHQEPSAADPTELDRVREDEQKPRFDGVVAGIRLIAEPAAFGPYHTCHVEEDYLLPLSVTDGSGLEIFLDRLPERVAAGDQAGATLCDKEVLGAGRSLVVDGTYVVFVSSVVRPEAWFPSQGPEDRTRETWLGTKSAVAVDPLVPDGSWTGSWVIFAEPHERGYLITSVEGPNAPIAVVERVAAQLLEDRSR